MEMNESCRNRADNALQEAIQALGIAPPSIQVSAASPLQSVSFKPKSLYTYFDYKECLDFVAESCGTKGEKTMFGSYTDTNLAAIHAALSEWESNNLHLLSSTLILTTLSQLTYPALKRKVDNLSSRIDELSRLSSEHERFRQSYERLYQEKCHKWGVTLEDSHCGDFSKFEECHCEDISDSLSCQLESIASNSHRMSMLETMVLRHINTPEFLEYFLYYHSFLSFLNSKLHSSSCSLNCALLPHLKCALRAGNTLTEEHDSELFCLQACAPRSSLDSSSSGDDWTHVLASDVIDSSGNNNVICCDLDPNGFLQILADKPSTRHSLFQEITLLHNFFQSQEAEREQYAKNDKFSKVDMSNIVLSKYCCARNDEFVETAIKTTQRLVDIQGREDYLNMLALENNPGFLARIRDDILLSYKKSKHFGHLYKRETFQRSDLAVTLNEVKQDLASVKKNIESMRSSLETSIFALFKSPMSADANGMKILGENLDFTLE